MNTDTPPDHKLERHPEAWLGRDFYRFWVTENVRFADIDALGHVNNNSYGIYFEVARIAMWTELYKGNFWKQPQFGLMRASHIEYHRETHYPSSMDIGVRILKTGNTSAGIVVGIFVGDQCHATSHSVMVMVDAKTHSVVLISDDWRAMAKTYM